MTPRADLPDCPDCREPLPSRARFCPSCGTAISPEAADAVTRTHEMLPEPPSQETIELRTDEPVEFAPGLHTTRRRTFGLEPTLALGMLADIALIATVVLFATGEWIAGIVCLGLTIGFATLFLSAVRHEPGSRISRAAATAGDRSLSWGRFAAVVLQAGVRAALELARIRRRRRTLRRELQRRLTPLGEAVLHEDAVRVVELKTAAGRTERELADVDRHAAAVIAAARRRVHREQCTVQPTQSLRTVPDVDGDPGSPGHA